MDMSEKIKLLKLQLERDASLAAQDKTDPKWLETGSWWKYMGKQTVREALYQSFTDEELTNILLDTAEQLGRNPHKKDVFCVYREFILERFEKWPWALIAAGLKLPREERRMLNRQRMERALEQRKQNRGRKNRKK